MSEYLDDNGKQDNSRSEKQNTPSAGQSATKSEKSKNPDKKKHFKVLHEDGSLADLPYNNEPGGGSLEGTVGLGT